ncbi:DNA (cytosine-5)-methyltransferase 1 [Paenibacillus sp. 1182]|uniref:DNA cytosine methyltransferase n=1 Tax=Paenibacillus sp. 1182 TaxID=2806565 RepID=UPI001AEB1974|nr:DNA cytosine methyltransferase [Paenibacillus sp. 1182]MBP1308881.1 DNA (cytosine-5)-methyltransferase 1 [Paenibacillus sp. 1182]
MREAIKRRLYKLKDRLYLEAKYLADYGFGIGQPIRYDIDKQNGTITVESVKENKKRVAKTTQKTGKTVPVIDIKATEVKSFFASHGRIFVEIVKGKIIFSIEEVVEEQQICDNVVSLDSVRETKTVFNRYAVGLNEFAKAVNFEQITIFDLFQNDSKNSISNKEKGKEKAISMLSLFSGCGTMDKAFLDQGFDIKFANDRYEKKALKDYHVQTYKHNIGDHILMRDVMELTEKDIPETDFVCAGIPCVTFSALNTKNNFRDSESDLHPIVEKTLDIIRWSKAKAFLFENVVNFIKVKKGLILQRLKERFPDFLFETKVIDATDLGSAQKRKRAFVLAIHDTMPSLDLPLVHEVRTVKDAFKGVELATQQDEFFTPTPKILERMKHVPQGGNVLDVPVELRAPRKTFSNYCQRLSERNQAPTITHVQDDVFFHPTKERYLTVRETSRLFSLPDEFEFKGSMTAKFEMLKNAVDYRVSTFLAKTVRNQLMPIL